MRSPAVESSSWQVNVPRMESDCDPLGCAKKQSRRDTAQSRK
jgi:hypothetical protein